MIILFVFLLCNIVSGAKEEKEFLPNLPLGEFIAVFDTGSSCEPTKNHKIAFNIYFSKKSFNVTELRGNITTTIPFDDTHFIGINLASWSSQGGWKDNAVVYKANNACTNTKKVLGAAFLTMSKTFGLLTNNCPIPPGTYISTGMNVNDLRNSNLPTVFYYGKYKFVFSIKTKEGKLLGCAMFQVHLVRPWEVPKY